jgi:predicted RNase H-like nuclease (RuvC/YqgF family)
MSTKHTTADLKKEIEKMEDDKEQLIKRLERVKKRVRSKFITKYVSSIID